MKNLKNSDGFSVIHVLLILVIVALVGFTGWYVWSASKESNKALDDAAKTSDKAEKNDQPDREDTPTKPTFSNNVISFTYPKDWTVEDETKAVSLNELTRIDVNVKSSDFKNDTVDYISVTDGGIFTVYAQKTTATMLSEIDDIDTAGEYVTNIKLSGVDAIRNDRLGGEIKNSIKVNAIHNGYIYTIVYIHSPNETNENARYLVEFEQFLNSIKFNY